MEKPLLSICIPTYNRCTYLKNTLNSIICQKEFQDGRVEIVISDNASTDETELMVSEYTLRYKNIRYFKNKKNIQDENFSLALSRGNGLYRKLSNDTYLYLPGILNYMCGMIQKYQSTEKLLCWMDGKGKYKKGGNIECSNFDDFVKTESTYAQWNGVFGIWGSECEKVTGDVSGCDLQMWQCKRTYELVEEKGEAVLVNRRLFFVQEVNGKNMSYGLYQVLYLNFLSILHEYVDKGILSQETFEKVRKDDLFLLISFFTRGKIKNIDWNFSDEEETKELVFNEVKKLGYWDEYQRQYRKSEIWYPIRMKLKVMILRAYIFYISHRKTSLV